MAVSDRGKQQESRCRHSEALLVDTALAQQHRLPAVKQRVNHGAPLLERGLGHHVRFNRARTSGRRSGGIVLGGWRRGGRSASSRLVIVVTSATAASNA